MQKSFHFAWRKANQHLAKAIPNAIEVTRIRLIVVMLLFCLAFGVITLRLFDLAILKGRVTVAESQKTSEPITSRAEIVDRNGELLATNLTTASLYARPSQISDVKEVIAHITKALPDINAAELRQKLASGKNFIWIKRNLTPNEQNAVNQRGIPGLFYKSEERRVYPQGRLFSHILGYVDVDGYGIAGIEKSFDDYLQPLEESSTPHAPLELALDMRVQSVVHEELSKKIKEFSAAGAAGIVMDVNTAEILAAVSLPDFDPHDPAHAADAQKFNVNTLGVYEMGSVFKTLTMAMALEMNKVKFSDRYDVSHPLQIANFTIRDSHPKNGFLSVPEIYIYSSNIGTARIAEDIGEAQQQKFLREWGMLSPLGLEIPEKASPLFPHAKQWGKLSLMTISYGHGIAVTPMHVVQATAALANGGIYRPATLMKRNPEKMSMGVQVVREDTSENVRRLMRYVVKYGTGTRAEVAGYMVGGKTGTADKPNKGTYDRGSLISSFVGVFPVNDPRYAILVMLDEPKGTQETSGFATGGATAAPAVRDIVSRIAPILNVVPVDETDPNIRKKFEIESFRREEKIAALSTH